MAYPQQRAILLFVLPTTWTRCSMTESPSAAAAIDADTEAVPAPRDAGSLLLCCTSFRHYSFKIPPDRWGDLGQVRGKVRMKTGVNSHHHHHDRRRSSSSSRTEAAGSLASITIIRRAERIIPQDDNLMNEGRRGEHTHNSSPLRVHCGPEINISEKKVHEYISHNL